MRVLRRQLLLGLAVSILGGCPYHMGMLASETTPIETRGPEVAGEACVITILGLTFGSGAFPDLAVQNAVARANSREQKKPGELYNAIADCTFTESYSPYSHCFSARGFAVRVQTEGDK